MSDSSQAPTLAVNSLSKHFAGLTALSDVSMEFKSGSITAIVGDNGAGKSTLLKIIAGVHSADSGVMTIEGQEVEFHSPSDAVDHGIATVYQDLALAPNQPVYLNMFLGRELVTRWPYFLRHSAMRKETHATLEELDVHVPSMRTAVKYLSGGQRQGIAIGRAARWARRIVLMDEPTAALGVQETNKVEGTIRSLKERGLTVLLVSHNLDQVFRLADRIYVMRRGHIAGSRHVGETTSDEIVSLITSGG